MKAGMEKENMDNYRGVRIGIAIECENGYFAGGAGGGWTYDNNHKRIKQFIGSGGDKHMENFIQAVRSRKPGDLKAPILGGHISSALCHMANISYRLGTQLPQAEIKERLKSRADIAETLGRFAEHLAANGVNMAEARPYLGAFLDVAREQEKFASSSEYDLGSWANRMIRRDYRPPFVVPEKV
jgi:hypothetical protein